MRLLLGAILAATAGAACAADLAVRNTKTGIVIHEHRVNPDGTITRAWSTPYRYPMTAAAPQATPPTFNLPPIHEQVPRPLPSAPLGGR